MGCPVIPRGKKLFGICRVSVIPQIAECFLDMPSANGLKAMLLDLLRKLFLLVRYRTELKLSFKGMFVNLTGDDLSRGELQKITDEDIQSKHLKLRV